MVQEVQILESKGKILFRTRLTDGQVQKIENDGHFGDCKLVGEGNRELRVNFAKG